MVIFLRVQIPFPHSIHTETIKVSCLLEKYTLIRFLKIYLILDIRVCATKKEQDIDPINQLSKKPPLKLGIFSTKVQSVS